MKSIHTLLIYILFMGLLSSCTNESTEAETSTNTHLLQISEAQFVAERMELGSKQMHTFNTVFKTNGIATVAPESKADIHSFLSGIIKQIHVVPGNLVRQGQTLLSIESKEFIGLQRQYLEALAQFKATEADYKRIKQLYDEKYSSQKDYYTIESQYATLKAKIQALKAELKIVNVNMSDLEAGNISSYLNIVSPISGYISELACNNGEFISSETMLLKIIDKRNLQLHFFVYQETIGNLQIGQKITIYSPNNSGKTYAASISSIGITIDKESKSIRCTAKPESDLNKIFVDGMYFQVEVVTDSLNAFAIPSEAIIKSANANYVLVKEKEDEKAMYFKKIKIKTGVSDDTFTQVIDENLLQDILIKGTYYF